MKSALLKDSIKQIKNTYRRFLSILLMAFLGVGFFAGLRASSPDMVDTIDQYYDNQNVYDIQVISTLGLTNEDIEKISELENIDNVQGVYEADGKIHFDNNEIITKIISLSDINKPVLIEGKMPEEANECVVEESFLTINNLQIGDTISLEVEKVTNDDGEEIDYLKEKNVKIVGTVQSPLYISRDRGTSDLGSGKIDYYMYIPQENVNANDVYTGIYIKVNNEKDYTTSSSKYEDYIESVKQNIEDIKEERQEARHNELVSIAQDKVDEAEDELNKEKSDAQKKIEDAEKELKDAKKEIKNAEEEISSNKEKADSQFASAKKQIDNAKNEIEDNEKKLEEQEKEVDKTVKKLKEQKEELKTNLKEIESNITKIEKSYNGIKQILKSTNLSTQEKATYNKQLKTLETQIDTLNENKKKIEQGIEEIDDGIETANKKISDAKKQIEDAKNQLEEKEKQYNSSKKTTYAKIEDAENELNDAKKELEDGEKELEENKKEFEEKIQDAENKLADAKEEILDIESPTWYILDRNSNAGYVGFIQDSDSIANIGKVFPVIFFIVATLISLTSMTRMVEEQRMQIGTLKALGYNKLQISMKYILYASLACIIGGILGMCVGFVLLPKIIWMMYNMMYTFSDNISISFNWEYGTTGLLLICLCIIGATVYTVMKELKDEPVVLMRPKAPKSGNRVIMERIPFIWNRLNFVQKVTVRNIFRYKKRFFMTIIGILGCTALIVTGFGIKDSISTIIPNQYGEVFLYNLQVTLKDSLTEDEKNSFFDELKENEKIEQVAKTYMTSGTAENGDASEDIQIIVPEEENGLEGIINITDIQTEEKVGFTENKICISDKLSELLDVKVGDKITIKDNDNREVEVEISNIIENYIQHYVFMSKSTYENLYNETYDTNVFLVNNTTMTEEEEDDLASLIMEQSEVASVSNISYFAQSIEDAMSMLDYVVVVLIVSAGLLAFVVLYNLSNVNISERIRELATIKVLGFYDREVYDYIARESIILTIIGIVFGLVCGYFLNYYIMGTCEINMLRFNKIIFPMSYVYSTLLTVAFTVIINVATYFSLKKINMVESLKSIE